MSKIKSFFTPREISQLVGISYRQLQYWDKTNFIRPSYRRRGKYRLYTFSDLIQLKLARLLRDRLCSIQRIRKTVVSIKDLLPQIAHPLVELTFFIEGDRVLVFNGEMLMSDPGNGITYSVKSLRDDILQKFPEPIEIIKRYT